MSSTATTRWDALWTHIHLATMASDSGYGDIPHAALAIKDGRIAWLGPQSQLPSDADALQHHDGNGAWVTPGLVDCHTHIVYAGNRSDEWEDRLNGVPYEAIARRGGGIVSTVRATREASFEDLLQQSLPRVQALMAEGVTTLEIKSGYGLDLQNEEKMLAVAREIGRRMPLTVRTTFLAAHALPPEYAGRADDYIDLVCRQMLPAVVEKDLVDAVDAFCEGIGFSPAQTERVFRAAQSHQLPVKLHAEQLSDLGGAALTARYQGLSADHLEHLSSQGIQAMAAAGTVAVLLPGAFYYLRDTRVPPVDELRAAGVPMAVATDCNPGTSPLTSILLAMNMACTLFRLTPAEALAGVTRHGAQALGLADQLGTLELGKRADFVFWAVDRPGDLAYAMGFNPCIQVVKDGAVVGRH